MSIEFNDYSIAVTTALQTAVAGCLHEAAGEIAAQAAKNSNNRVRTGKTKGSWSYVVDSKKGEAKVGSPLENAVWEEFGTGEYALNGDGRAGGWWIKVGMGANEMPPDVAAAYKWEDVRKDKDGNITFVFTRGKKPNRALQRAFDAKKRTVEEIFENGLKEELDS